MSSRNLSIQIQPDRVLAPNKEQIVQEFVGFLNDISPLKHCHVSRGNENGPYINIDLKSENVQLLWEKIQIELSLNTNVASAIVVVCEGKKGWDDYLLLYHYDASEHVDSFNGL